MSNKIEYKGYYTEIKYSQKDKVLYGKIEFIDDLIKFERDTAEGIELEFRNAVDDYIEFCKQVGKEPQKPYKGSFNVRVSPEMHKKAANEAMKKGCSLNAFVEQSLKDALEGKNKQSVQMNLHIHSKGDDAHNMWEQTLPLNDAYETPMWDQKFQS